MPSREETIFTYARLSEEDLCRQLGSSRQGLQPSEIAERRKYYGPNLLKKEKAFRAWIEFFSHFKNPLVLILLVASVLSFVLHDATNAIIIFLIVIISAVMDFVEERGAHRAAEKLRESVRNTVVAVRGGMKNEIFSEDLVPGDIVLLNAGKIIPADARVLEADDFFVNQSALTGESFPAEKNAQALTEPAAETGSLPNMVFMGSSVVSGSATALVIATGMDTQFGDIAARLLQGTEETSFSRGIRRFGYLVVRITLLLVLFIFLVNGILKSNWLESFMFALAVAVGLTPELLTMIMSVTMARGSLQMAKKGAIVKRLSAIPNLGSMDILCTDKTGTLTQDRIELVKYLDASGKESEQVLEYGYLNSYFETGIKNPLDDALMNFRNIPVADYTKVDEIPFDFFRKKLSVVVEKQGMCRLITKGAPEEIFKSCSSEIAVARDLYKQLSREGYRVLAIASKQIDKRKQYPKDEEKNLDLDGFLAFLDPPKEEVGQTLGSLRELGIEIKIITGDNELVTEKICNDIGLPVREIMLGREMQELTDDALRVRAQNCNIFARFSPDQKNRVIRALQANHSVGYMGDGINDAPSLQTADVGVSVNNATDIAKASADIILTQKSLLLLKDAVIEGRKTFGNTIKYIQMGLSSNFGNMFSMAAAAVFLPFLPMLPVQILLNNFLYDFSQVTIPTDRVDGSFIMKPRQWDVGFIRRFMLLFGPISSVFDLLTFFIFYVIFHVSESQFQTAWFLESISTQTFVIFIIRSRKLSFRQNLPSRQLVISSVVCVCLAWIIAQTGIGRYLKFSPLDMEMILVIAGLVLVYLAIVEGVKFFFYRREEKIAAKKARG